MRVLVSTSDKTGLLEFLKPLKSLNLEIVSTGGTFKFLKENSFDVVDVAEVTGFPEVLDGRVKTLNPRIHMGLLADMRDAGHVAQMKEHNVKNFDMVVGNLYPFEKAATDPNSTLEDLIENIDIGGPSFLRASAKNYHNVIVVCSPNDYQMVQTKIVNNSLTLEDRLQLALKVFSLTSYYDSLIVQRLAGETTQLEYLNLPLKLKQSLRYGENAHQKATWFCNPLIQNQLADAAILQGKELSYNNLLDLDATIQLIKNFDSPTCVAVKHNNPCGAASGKTLADSVKLAIESDPKSIFGGIIALNKPVDGESAKFLGEIFLECIAAPSFSPEALQIFGKKKNLRLLQLPTAAFSQSASFEFKSIYGGALKQESDSFGNGQNVIVGENPSLEIYEALKFGEKITAFLKSNAISIVCGQQTAGLGMGQVNRVDAVNLAIQRAKDFSLRTGKNMGEFVLVSDAFFPFPDSIELISSAGIRWIVQPGGSVQDESVIAAAKKLGINMVLTGKRHFKH